MTEDPIKLFAPRADRYPQPNDIDATRTALEKTAELVPVLGPVTVHVIGQFLVPGVERRREEWFKTSTASRRRSMALVLRSSHRMRRLFQRRSRPHGSH
jgi:hypothetical protein